MSGKMGYLGGFITDRVPTEDRHCENPGCGKRIARENWTPSKYKTRRYCSTVCSNQARRKKA